MLNNVLFVHRFLNLVLELRGNSPVYQRPAERQPTYTYHLVERLMGDVELEG